MKIFLISYFLFLISFLGIAHPGIGIVKDSKGNIYYTDLKQVWKINVEGKRSVIVNGVHTHELFVDNDDNLFGEHLWYNGEKLDTWEHYLWRLNKDGVLDTIIKPTEGFLENYSFYQDSLGNMYSVQRFKPKSKIIKTAPNGAVTILAEREFKDIRWMFVTPGGALYFVDLTDLYKIENGTLTLVASSLEERTSLFEYSDLQHNVYGIWNDTHKNIYVAILGGQVVKKITPGGQVSDIVYSRNLWRPSSGVFDNNDNLWLMETNAVNEVRVRMIGKDELATTPLVFTNILNKARPFFIVMVALLFLSFVFLKIRKILKRKLQPVI
jgi:hypothetical protein